MLRNNLRLVNQLNSSSSTDLMDLKLDIFSKLGYATLEQAPFALYWVDEYAVLKGANTELRTLLGYDVGELLKLRVMDINPEYSLKAFQTHFKQVREGSKEKIESVLIKKDGAEVPVEIQSKYFHEVDIICHFVTNVKKQRQIERKLLVNQERLRVGLEILNEGVWDWDIPEKRIFFSQQFAENLGYSLKKLHDFADKWKEFLHPDDATKYSIRLADHLKGLTKKYESEHRMLTSSGEYRWFKDRGMVIERDESGRAIRMIGSSLDITERLALENKLKSDTEKAIESSKNLSDNILRFSSDAIVIMDVSSQLITEVNPKALEFFGKQKVELKGKSLSDFIAEDEKPIDNFLNSVSDKKAGLSNKFVFRSSDGSQKAAEVSATYYGFDEDRGIILVIQPISQQKHIEGIIAQIVDDSLSKSKMDFIPSFIQKIAETANVNSAGISQVVDGANNILRIVSLWHVDHFETSYDYNMLDTPSQEVLANGILYHKDNVAKKFPSDTYLQDMGARGYLGVPIYDSNKNAIGHLFIMDKKPLEKQVWIESLLAIGASRMGLEIERKRVEDELKSRLKLEGLISDISTEFINANPDSLSDCIKSTLKKIGEHVNADRAYIFKYNKEKEEATTTQEWVRTGITKLKSKFIAVRREKYPWPFQLMEEKKMLLISDVDTTSEDIGSFREVFDQYGIKSMLNVPMVVANNVYGYLGFDAERKNYWSINDIVLLKLVAEVIVNSIERVTFEKSLKKINDNLELEVHVRTKELKSALQEVEELRDKLEAENIYLKEEIDSSDYFENIISQDTSFKGILKEMEQVARTNSTVLILGETGTGKEVISKAIHNLSSRKDKPLIKINCAALPATLIESELFGHEKGAFTGASSAKQGRFELANGGTLFLDEVGEMPIELQPKLLRAIQEGEFERLGGTKTIKVDVRLIAATNRNLEKEIKEGNFRSDLYYRLNVFPISIPPLRERKKDINLLINHFVQKYNLKLGKNISKIPQSVVNQLEKYDWPGNIRELENIIERAVIISSGSQLKLGDWFVTNLDKKGKSDFETLERFEKNYIIKVLQHTGWKVSGAHGAAEILNVKPTTLESKMKKLGISRK